MFETAISRDGMSYERRGEHDGATVVLVHGIPGAGRAWHVVASALPGGLQVVVPDLLGFGGSARPKSASLDTLGPSPQSTALANLLDDLGVRDAVVVGHDFGGPISILLAERRPDLVAGLLVLAANTFPDTPIPFPLSLTTAPLVGGLAARAIFSRPSLAMMLRQGVGAGPSPDAATYIGDDGQHRAIAAIFSGALRGLRELYAPVESALRGLDVPVVVGWGDKDPFFPLAQGRRTAEAARGELRVFAGAGHFLPHERPDEVASEIEKLSAARAR
ncbi:MAG TPA: alpha/beta hydrolase [Acidimicrobiales bacterium]|nr:alpha/beta hydrolase [Acidimicrobiales bacterium]